MNIYDNPKSSIDIAKINKFIKSYDSYILQEDDNDLEQFTLAEIEFMVECGYLFYERSQRAYILLNSIK